VITFDFLTSGQPANGKVNITNQLSSAIKSSL